MGVSLTDLANHLLTGKPLHKEFNFSSFNSIRGKFGLLEVPEDPNACGTVGCAFGEMPGLDPRITFFNIKWTDSVRFSFECGTSMRGGELAEKYWGIGRDEFYHLFIPYHQDTVKYGGKDLSDLATKEEVANNILEFVRITGIDKCILPD